MDAQQLRSLTTAGETFDVEFKESTARRLLSDADLVEAVMCLANGTGGTLLIGVDDQGRISGAAPRHGEVTDANRLSAMIMNKLEPSVPVVTHVVDVDGHQVIAIEVAPTRGMPVGTKGGVYKRRAMDAAGRPQCVPFRAAEMISLGLSLQGLDWALQLAPGATIDHLDPDEFSRFRRLSGSGGDELLADSSDQDILLALRLRRGAPMGLDEITLGAILLFGRPEALEQWIPTAEVLVQDFRKVSGQANDTLRSPLFATLERVDDFIRLRSSETELMFGLHRVAIPLVPRSVVREAVANALVHRDYTALGSTVVQLDEDAFRVTNPGGLPPGVTLENLLESSTPRSPAIAEAVKRAGLVDRRGKGVNEMFSAMLRLGRGEPDYTHTTSSSVAVAVPTSRADLDMIRFVFDYEDSQQRSLTLNELRVLHEVRASGSAAVPEIVDALHLSTAVARSTTTRLLEAGLIEIRGSGRNRRFHLAAAFYTHAADKNAYVRVRGVTPLQQEQMIISYLETYGQITRSQAADLCMISPYQARALLKRMVDQGSLRLHGERRAAHYVLAADQ